MDENKEQKLKDDVDKNTKTNKSTNSMADKSGLAVTALVLSIIALPISFIPILNIVGLIVAIVAVILGFVGVVKKQKKVLSIIAIVIAAIAIIMVLLAGVIFGSFLSKFNKALKDPSGIINEIKDNAEKITDTIDNSFKTDEVLDDASDTVDPTTDGATNDETKYMWSEDFDVEIGELDVVEEEYTHTSKLDVIVTNKSNERKTLQIKIDAMSPEGFRINHDSGYIYDLGPGQKEKIELFKYFSASKLKEMKTATFEVSEIESY